MKGKYFRGVLREGQSSKVSEYLSSLKEDVHLFRYEINLLIAHTLSLLKANVIPRGKAKKILSALLKLRKDRKFIESIKGASYVESPEFYDIHPVIENYIIEKIGMEYGGYLNLGKSRNDSIVTDMMAFMRDVLLKFGERVYELGLSLLEKSKEFEDTPFISFTHQQPAQLTTFGYILYAHAYSVASAVNDIRNAYSSINISPLGACAVAGTSIPIDRAYTAELLGFSGIIDNAVYATSSRDFVIRSAFPFVIIMNSLSKLSADFLFFSSMGYNYITVPDRLTDTSSAMPHKKNLSPLELLRARAEKVNAQYHSMLSTINGRISGYNQDFQELKVHWWDISETSISSVEILKMFVDEVKVNRERVEEDIPRFFITAIDLAELLTLKYGIPFREAHSITGRIVSDLIEDGKSMKDLTPALIKKKVKETLKIDIPVNENDLVPILEPMENLRLKSGFYSKERFNLIYNKCKKELEDFIKWVRDERMRLIRAEERLINEAQKVIRG